MKMIRRQPGFTLFEMVIAVSIFALMGVVAFGGISQMTRSGQTVANANDRLSDLQFALIYFNRDWSQVSPRKIRNQYGDEESNIRIEDGLVTFTRSGWSNLTGQARSNLQRVQYFVRDNKMIRRHWLSLDQGIGEEPIERVLLDGIESMEIVFWNSEEQPIGEWPLSLDTGGGAPIILALNLELPDLGEIQRLYEVPDGVL